MRRSGVVLMTFLAVPPANAEDVETAGHDKVFFLGSADGAFRLEIGGLIQAQYAYGTNLEGGDAKDESSAFTIPRARLQMDGHAFGEELEYSLVTDFGKGGFVTLKDGYVDWNFGGKACLRGGQYKRPFSRQQLTGDSRLELIDRSVVDDGYGLGRDIGVMLHNGFSKSPPFEVAAGVFNGTGDKPVLSADALVDITSGTGEIDGAKLTNDPGMFHPMVVVRAGGNFGEDAKGYSELDLEGGAPRGGIAANAALDFDADQTDDGTVLVGADWYFKASGFAATGGYVLGMAQTGTAWTNEEVASMGFWQQASFAGKHVAVALRYARFMPEGANNDVQEVALGVPILGRGHALKLQNEVGFVQGETAGDPENALTLASKVVLDF